MSAPRRLDWQLCDRMGNRLADLDQRLPGAYVEVELNGTRRAQIAASIEEEVAQYAKAFATTLKVWLNGTPIFNGPVTLPRWLGGDRIVELSAINPMEALSVGYVRGLARQDQIDKSTQMMTLVSHLNARAAFGSWPTPGVIQGTLAASILADQHYPDGTSVGEAIVALSQSQNGPDFDLRPLDGTDGNMAALDTYFPSMGSDKTEKCVFTFNTQENNCADFTYEPGGGEIVNLAVVSGQATEGQAAPAWIAYSPASMDAHGIYEHFEALPEERYTANLAEVAEILVATRAYPVEFFDLTPAVEAGSTAFAYARDDNGLLSPTGTELAVPPRFGPDADYWIGDEIRCIARDSGIDRDLTGRVTYGKLTETGEHGELLAAEITAAPSIEADDVTGAATTVSVEDFG